MVPNATSESYCRTLKIGAGRYDLIALMGLRTIYDRARSCQACREKVLRTYTLVGVKMWVVVNERAMIAAFEAATQARVAAIGAAQPSREPQPHDLRPRMVQ